ncbi:MAG: hypothetical protein WD733_01980 [Bryobacterales bacterium]
MKERLPHITLFVLLLLWLGIAAPGLSERYAKLNETSNLLGNRSAAERSALLDNPAVPVAREIEKAVPAEGCVAVLAYAGPAAIDYYRARFAYLLYPRRVQVFADSTASAENCEFVAVFRDSRQNLAAEPFQGAWDDAELDRRLQSFEPVAVDGPVRVFRTR